MERRSLRIQKLLAALGLLVAVLSPLGARAETIELQLLQLNDVYEIGPVEGGRSGGLARVATLLQQLKSQQPRTLVVLAGDLLSPSALETAVVDGERLQGRQMVAVLNRMGLDVATFGNHEFDLPEEALRKRLAESRFRWISSNVRDRNGQALPGVENDQLLLFEGAHGGRFRLGIVGVTLPSNPAPYVRYSDVLSSVDRSARQLRRRGADAVVALTHLTLEQDQQLAASGAPIDLILGGHEHENIQQLRLGSQSGRAGTPDPTCPRPGIWIGKADANARSVLVHSLRFETTNGCLQINSRLQPIDASLSPDPQLQADVEHWEDLAFSAFQREGLQPRRVISLSPIELDGREAQVRNGSTGLTRLIGAAMLRAAPGSDLAIYNAGSIHIDDRIPAGPVSDYDVIRVLPFGGTVEQVELTGKQLQTLLNTGQSNRGSGGYLQVSGVTAAPAGTWLIHGEPLMPQRRYRVAINDFLLSGKEAHLGWLAEPSADLVRLQSRGDWRQAVIQELQQQR